MQEAVPEGRGAMAAVLGLGAEEVRSACEAAAAATGRVVSPANFNSTQQTVIAGDSVAVEAACARALQEGAKRAIPLAVSAPFHCELMASAAAKLAIELARVHFSDANPPVVTNVEALPNTSASRMAELLERQVTQPVRFTEMIRKMAELGVDRVLEVGVGRVLVGLVARIERSILRASFASMADLTESASFATAEGA
jgi:[acyl-carrier-protein] S-malonyltransferase